MLICIYSFLTGLAVGAIFALLKLPIPAPQTLAGILGIVGLWLGFFLINLILQKN